MPLEAPVIRKTRVPRHPDRARSSCVHARSRAHPCPGRRWGRRLPELSAGGARPQGRTRRRGRRPRGRRGAGVQRLAAGSGDASAAARTSRRVAADTGRVSLRHGADGETLEIIVPPGTEVLVEEDGSRHDLVRPGQRAVVARGGAGGRGNKRFAGPTHQTPRFAERGLSGRRELGHPAAEAAGRRGTRRSSQRRQVVAAGAADPRPPQGGRTIPSRRWSRRWGRSSSRTGSWSSPTSRA